MGEVGLDMLGHAEIERRGERVRGGGEGDSDRLQELLACLLSSHGWWEDGSSSSEC